MAKVPVDLYDSESLWYAVGTIFGDGSCYKYKNGKGHIYRIELKVQDKDFALEFKRCLENIGLNARLYKRVEPKYGYRQGFSWQVTAHSKLFHNWFKEINYGKIIALDEQFIIQFLRGVFDSDGYLPKKRLRNAKISSNNKEFIMLLKKLIETLGFKTSTFESYGQLSDRTIHNVHILEGKEGTKKFIKLLNPSIKRKRCLISQGSENH